MAGRVEAVQIAICGVDLSVRRLTAQTHGSVCAHLAALENHGARNTDVVEEDTSI